MSETPPRGLGWTNTPPARAITTVVAIVALLVAGALGIRQQAYINCVAEQQRLAATRTAAIAKATDRERAAQRALIQGVKPENSAELRDAVLRSYDSTDQVRAENPPPLPGAC